MIIGIAVVIVLILAFVLYTNRHKFTTSLPITGDVEKNSTAGSDAITIENRTLAAQINSVANSTL